MKTEAARQAYEAWKACVKDEELQRQLAEMEGQEELIARYFMSPLSFGTAGLRGVMAPGVGAMNLYTVARATKGLAMYLLHASGVADAAARGVVIGRDSRIHSSDFAKITAGVLAGCGVKVYLFDDLRPTPMVSFAVRELHAIAGVNITASHNPKEYNGYKVYYEDGAQISPEQAKVISAEIEKIPALDALTGADFERALAEGKIVMLGEQTDERYLERVLAERVDPALIPRASDRLRIVYTPFHGAGRRLVPEVLRRCGVRQLFTVEAQMTPDGHFPTVASPNPENPEGFALGVALAKKVDSDLVIATDPDADRVGVMAKDKTGRFRTVTGNRMGALLLDYILRAHAENGSMPPQPYAVKTIVTTELAAAICRRYRVRLHNVLTGFKYIGEIIKQSEEKGEGSFILGFEESYGYLKGSYARDKDAVVASMLICEMAAYYKEKGMTLCDAEEEMLETYGYFAEKTENLTMQDSDGQAKMTALMARLRERPPQALAEREVLAVRDYLSGVIRRRDGSEEATGLPRSDVLYFELAGGSSLVVRPSGTEPKVKIYLMAKGKDEAEAAAMLAALGEEVRRLT